MEKLGSSQGDCCRPVIGVSVTNFFIAKLNALNLVDLLLLTFSAISGSQMALHIDRSYLGGFRKFLHHKSRIFKRLCAFKG